MNGKTFEEFKIGDRYINGVYMVEIMQGKNRKVLKLVKM